MLNLKKMGEKIISKEKFEKIVKEHGRTIRTRGGKIYYYADGMEYYDNNDDTYTVRQTPDKPKEATYIMRPERKKYKSYYEKK